MSVSIINPLLLEIAHDYRIPVALAAQARTIQATSSAVMALIAIFAADRIGRRQQLLYGLGLQGIAALALSVPQPFGVWLIGQAAYGAAAAVVGLAGTAAVGDYVPKSRRASAMAWVATGYAIAFLVGLPLAGWLATGWGWRASYVWAGAGTALVALIGVVVGLPTRQLAVIGAPAQQAGWLRILTEPASRGWVVGELLSMTGWSVFLVYVGPFFGVTYGLRATEIGLVLAILSAIAILGIRASVPWGRVWGMRRLLLASTFLAAVTALVPLSLRLSPLLSLLAVAPFMFLGSLRHPTSATIGLGLLPDAKGAMMAARGLTVAVAGLLAASTGGIVLAISGFLGLGPWCAALLGMGWAFYRRSIPEGIDRSCTTSQGEGSR